MDDWIKEAVDRVDTDAASQRDVKEQFEWEERTAVSGTDAYFESLKHALENDAPGFGQGAFHDPQAISIAYRLNTNDGLHFLLVAPGHVYLIERLPDQNRIEATLLLAGLRSDRVKIPRGFLCVQLIDRKFRDKNGSKVDPDELGRRMLETLYSAHVGKWTA